MTSDVETILTYDIPKTCYQVLPDGLMLSYA